MRINQNISTVDNTNNILQQQIGTEKKLVSGKRINSAADDAAGLQIANKLSSSINAKMQGERNLYDGISLSRVYEQALQGVNDNFSELSRLAVAAGNGIYGEQERAALQTEADAYVANARQIIDNAEFAGKKLFGDDAAIAFGTGTDSVNLTTTDVAAGLNSRNAFQIDLSSANSAADALTRVSDARDFIGELQSQAGAESNRFASAASNLAGQQIAESAARSRIADLDYAKATSEKTAADILSNTSVSVALQGRVMQQQALRLLE